MTMAKITVTVGSEKTRTYTGPKEWQRLALDFFIAEHDPFSRPVSQRIALDSKEAEKELRRR
jgi:hypothetical protein